MSEDALKLTTYFGERDRAGDRFLADALVDIYERHEVRTSAVFRGIEGFGVKHRLQTDRLLTLSEDLPIVSVAVDARPRIEHVLPEVEAVSRHGLITLERARMLTDRAGAARLPEQLVEANKLTVYVGRQQRAGGRPAYEAVVALLHRRGVAGATVLLGVDGTAHGVRQRARFFARNADVPLMIVSVGDGDRIAAVLSELSELLATPLMTLERVRVCKRDGRRLAEPPHVPQTDAFGMGLWQKLMVFAGEQASHDGAPLHTALIRRLREAGAAGATALRGVWGYHGDHAPHGDRFWALRRHVAVVTVIVVPHRRRGHGRDRPSDERDRARAARLRPRRPPRRATTRRAPLRVDRGRASPRAAPAGGRRRAAPLARAHPDVWFAALVFGAPTLVVGIAPSPLRHRGPRRRGTASASP